MAPVLRIPSGSEEPNLARLSPLSPQRYKQLPDEADVYRGVLDEIVGQVKAETGFSLRRRGKKRKEDSDSDSSDGDIGIDELCEREAPRKKAAR